MNITSLDNQKVKKLKKLQSKKYRDIEGEFVVEGEHLVLEAYKAGVLEEAVLLDGEENSYDFEVTYCSLEVMKKISSLDTFSKIVGLCKKKEMKEVLGAKILLLDGIQDPGNLGTIIRSSLAFNIDTIILSPNNYQIDVKKFLVKNGFYIDDEELVKDKKFIYQIIKFKKGKRHYSKKEYFFGPVLIKKKGTLFEEYYKREKLSREILISILPKNYRYKKFITKREIKMIDGEI